MKYGTVVNCLKLNIYKKMSETSEIVEKVNALTKLQVLEDLKMEDFMPVKTKYGVHFEPISKDFIRVKTEWGVTGYVNKKYIVIQEDQDG